MSLRARIADVLLESEGRLRDEIADAVLAEVARWLDGDEATVDLASRAFYAEWFCTLPSAWKNLDDGSIKEPARRAMRKALEAVAAKLKETTT